MAERPPRRLHETAPTDLASIFEPELAASHPNVRLCHPAVSWAKVVRGVEPANGRGGCAFSGPFLHKNGQNDVPIGSIPITSHEVGSRRHPRRERVASLVWIDADDQPLRVPMGSANRTDLDFRDYVAGYLSMPAAGRDARLLDALYSGEPGPHNAISSRPDRERRLITRYADAIQNTIEALETVGATGAQAEDEPRLEIVGTRPTAP